LHGLKALRAPSLRGRVLGEVTEAQLLQGGLTPEDVHLALGHYFDVPLEVLLVRNVVGWIGGQATGLFFL
jgi:hypothetical protein